MVFNASILRKEPCSDGFNPFCLKDYIHFEPSVMAVQTFKQPVAFISGNIKPMSLYEQDIKNGNVDSSSLYADKNFAGTSQIQGPVSVELLEFKPGEVKIEATVQQDAFLTLLQSYYPGWKVTRDGNETAIIKTNTAFMTVELPAGRHRFTFNFCPPFIYLLGFIQWFSYLVMGVVFFLNRKRTGA